MSARLAMLLLLLAAPSAPAQHDDHHGMRIDAAGVVMNENLERLPRGCEALSGEHAYTIHAGTDYRAGRPGVIYGMSQHEVRVPPCSRVTVRFVNDDAVRHQWMVHGLPKYLYPAGMFHIEAMGGHEMTGTFIVPPEDRTYLIHCDLAQHMEKGMRGQLVVGAGSGNLWGVPGISDAYYRHPYLSRATVPAAGIAAATAFAVVFLWRRRTLQRRA